MTSLIVVGFDPGPTTGICVLEYYGLEDKPRYTLLQAEGNSALTVLDRFLRGTYLDQFDHRQAGIESFVPSRGAGNTGKDAEFTRELIPLAESTLRGHDFGVWKQTAADAKSWATDNKLVKVLPGVRASIHGKSRDAFDAARHALYCACKNGSARNPLY